MNKKQNQQSKARTKHRPTRSPASWDAMRAALKFALPCMEDLANSSDNENEHRAARLMRDAIATAEKS
jgi:hypothetical protein